MGIIDVIHGGMDVIGMSKAVCVSQLFYRQCKPSQSGRRVGFITVSDRCIQYNKSRIIMVFSLSLPTCSIIDTVARDRGKPFAIVLAALPLPLPLPPQTHTARTHGFGN